MEGPPARWTAPRPSSCRLVPRWTVLPLPYIPEPRPDELVGNVLTDIIDANSLGSKHVLMKWLGFTRAQRNAQFMDISVLTPTWIELSEKLGIKLKDLVEALSTKPYWACFHTRRRITTAKLSNAEIADLRVPELVLVEQAPMRAELQLCPECLREDGRPSGTPYVHRSHQLPGTFVCHEHKKKLFCRCPACDKVLAPNLDLVRISTRCECGHDLTKGASVAKTAALYRLALFEHDCLYSTYPPRPGREVIAFIARTCRERNVSMQALAVNTFGDDLNRWRGVGLRRTPEPRLRLQYDGMPALCACLVALGFDYAHAHEAIEKASASIPPSRHTKALLRPNSTAEARDALASLRKTGEVTCWSTLRRRWRFVFWCLFLNDHRGLQRELGTPRTAATAAPSIREDRKTILTSVLFSAKLEAKARAYYRDKEWLDRLSLERNAARTDMRDAKLVGMVRTAMERAYASPQRPVKFTRRHAALAAGMSLVGISDLDRRRRSIDGHLWESVPHHWCRLLLWALGERLARGARLSPNLLIGEAGGLEKRFMQRFYAASIIYLFGPDARADRSA